MNILIFKFPYSSQFGGGEKHTLTLVKKLQERGHKFFLISSCKVLLREFRKKNWQAKRLWAGPEPVAKWSAVIFFLIAPFIILELFFVLLYYRLVKKVKLLYCLSLTEKITITPLARILGMRVVWVEHTLIGRWLSLNPWRLFYMLWAPLTVIVTVSYAVQKRIKKLGVRKKHIKVIYNGVDVAKCEFKPAVKSYREYFTIGTICRLHKEKGVEYLLKAVKIAKEFIPNLRLIVIGDGPERHNLIWLTKQLKIYDGVLFVGWQKEITRWVKDFDIFVLSSIKKEALGIVSLEAMACGKPVVATHVGGIPEVVDVGKSGILVEPGNPEMLAQAIINLHRHPQWRREMGVIGRQTVEKKFSEERMVGEYEGLFRKLVERKK